MLWAGKARRRCLGGMLALLLAVLPGTAPAADAAGRPSLTVVADDNYPPYIFRNPDGGLEGYLVDAWKLWERKTGVRVNLVATDWAQAQKTLAAGQADVIELIFRTPERERYLQFSKPYADLPVPIYTHRDIGGIADVDTLRGFMVGVKAGDACAERLQTRGVTNLLAFGSYERLVEAAAENRVKVFCLDEPPANYLLYRQGADQNYRKAFVLYRGQVHRAVNKGNEAALRLVEQGFDAFTPEEQDFLATKWMGSELEPMPWGRNLAYGLAVALALGAAVAAWGMALRRQVQRRTAELENERGRLRTLINTLPDLVWLKDPDGVFLACNAEFELLFGHPEAEIVGRTDYDFVPPELADFFRGKDAEAVARGGPGVNEEEVVYASDGHRVLLETIKTPMFDAHGRLIGVLGIGRDITARRQAEKAAAEIQERFLVAFRASPVAASIARARDGLFIEANDKYLRDFGWARDEIVGHSSLEIGLWPDAGARDAWVRELREKGTVVDYETLWHDRRRRLRRVSISAEMTSLHGEPHIFAYSIDITERRAAEDELRDRQAYTKVLFDESRLPIGVIDPASLRFLECNQAALDIHGLPHRGAMLALTPVDLSPPLQADGSDSTAAAAKMVARALAAGAHAFEWRHRRPDGEEWDAEVRLMRFTHRGQTLLQFSLGDITERKRQEKELRLAAQVYENTAEGILITHPDGSIAAVNRAFTAITGYSAAEVLGRRTSVLRSGRHEPMFYQELWDSLLQTGLWQGEIWNRRKNGEIYPGWQTISAVRDEEGRTSHYVAVFSDITTVKRSQEALNFLAHHDPLTELPNRILLRDRLEHALQRARREGGKLAVLFIDLDRFKHINDTLGHPTGDEILRQAALAMSGQVRASDTIARVGGDEFVVLLEDELSVPGVAAVAQKLVELFTRPFEVRGRELYVTASLGISLFPSDGDDADTLLQHADLAMYKAKEQGRNNFQFYEAAMGAGAFERMIVENALRGAVQRRELLLHYQPQVDLATGRLAGVEALVRWQHPELGLVPPGRFIPVAEEMGIIGEIGDWVLRESCRQMAAWQADGFSVPRVAVNLSMQQLEVDGLVGLVSRLLSEYRLPARQLELEVTESVIMRQTGRAVKILEGLRQLGVYLAVDDFGTGYSSLGYLRQLPVHRLKIDYSFVRDIGRDSNDETIACAIIGLGRSLGLEVVAEGVEREEQAAFLRREGCEVAQGYLYARPMAPAELQALWQGPERCVA